MGAWMLVGVFVFAIVVLFVIGLVVYWAMRLALRHERRPQSLSERESPIHRSASSSEEAHRRGGQCTLHDFSHWS